MTTFEAYRSASLPNDIYNPMANIYAAVNYAIHTYGRSLMRNGMGMGSGHGYDSGGWLSPGATMTVNNTGKPEAILTPAQSAAFVSLTQSLLSGPGHGTTAGASNPIVTLSKTLGDPHGSLAALHTALTDPGAPLATLRSTIVNPGGPMVTLGHAINNPGGPMVNLGHTIANPGGPMVGLQTTIANPGGPMVSLTGALNNFNPTVSCGDGSGSGSGKGGGTNPGGPEKGTSGHHGKDWAHRWGLDGIPGGHHGQDARHGHVTGDKHHPGGTEPGGPPVITHSHRHRHLMHPGGGGPMYDSGGWLDPGVTLAVNNTRRPEAILTGEQWEDVHRAGGVDRGAMGLALAEKLDRLIHLAERNPGLTAGGLSDALNGMGRGAMQRGMYSTR